MYFSLMKTGNEKNVSKLKLNVCTERTGKEGYNRNKMTWMKEREGEKGEETEGESKVKM